MRILVTGAGGYLGGAVTRALIRRGHDLATLQRGNYPGLAQAGIEVFTGDVADPDAVKRASRGCEVVVHVAGKTGVWGALADYHHTNVTGTENVIAACRENRVTALVYTSTPSVVFDGNDEVNVDETRPYPDRFLNPYQATKAAAEQRVLEANCRDLATLALRPHLIWGPGDPHLIGRILDRARRGRLRLVRADNRIDTTYIANAAEAHVLAAENLHPGAPCAGRAYFISNGEPRPMAEIVNRILDAAGLPPAPQSLSPATAYAVGLVMEWAWRIAGIESEPLLTRFVARQLARDHWYDISASRRELGYRPRVTIDEGMRRLEHYFKNGHDSDLDPGTA